MLADDLAVRVRDVQHSYETASGALPVLTGVSFDITAGEIVAVTGASGAGKSTLLALLGGLEPLQHGTIEVAGSDLAALTGDQLAVYRRETVGFVFQDFGLLGQLTALENVELALSFRKGARGARRARARELLEAVGLGARLDHRPHALSGGENQRVAIARALANRPRLVLADEPTGNLDDGSTETVLDLLESLPVAYGCTLLLVTHDPRVASRAHRTLALAEGRLAEAMAP